MAFWWWLDGYADFDEVQSRQARERIAQWFAWHRRSQLPDAAALLARMHSEVLADTSPDRACRWWSEWRQRAETAAEQALPGAADVVTTLTPAQIQHVERRYARNNDEFRRDFLDKDPARRLERSVERAVERAEFFYGTLDEGQRALVARGVARRPSMPRPGMPSACSASRRRCNRCAGSPTRRPSVTRRSPRCAPTWRTCGARRASPPALPGEAGGLQLQLRRQRAQQHDAGAAPSRRREVQGLGSRLARARRLGRVIQTPFTLSLSKGHCAWHCGGLKATSSARTGSLIDFGWRDRRGHAPRRDAAGPGSPSSPPRTSPAAAARLHGARVSRRRCWRAFRRAAGRWLAVADQQRHFALVGDGGHPHAEAVVRPRT